MNERMSKNDILYLISLLDRCKCKDCQEDKREMEGMLLEIETITPPPLPFHADDKIFLPHDEEGNAIGEPQSFNDWIEKIENISGVNPEMTNGDI